MPKTTLNSRRAWVKAAFQTTATVAVTCAAPMPDTKPGARGLAREDFPIARRMAYLNNAAWHPPSHGTLRAVHAYFERKANESSHVPYGPVGDEVKAQFAALIHAPASSISFIPSTTVGENLIVAGMDLANTRGNIVTDALHYESSTYLYRTLQSRGVDVRFVQPRKGKIELADVERVVDSNTKLVAISAVSYLNGFQHDLKALSELAHSRGAYVYADLVQAAGTVPIDITSSGVDFCACGSHKWLMGDMGLGFLYAREDLLEKVVRRTQYGSRQVNNFENHVFADDLTPDHAATWRPRQGAASFFEVGTLSQSTIAALSYSLPFIQRLGVTAIQAHAASLIAILRNEVPRLGFPCITPEDSKSSIISFAVKNPTAASVKLERAKVDVKFDQHLMRISPSVYNDNTDIDRLLEALA